MNEPTPDRAISRIAGNIPAWITMTFLIVGTIGGGGALYSDVQARVGSVEELVHKNELRIDQQNVEQKNLGEAQSRLDKEISVHLARIQTDLAYIKDKMP